MSFFVTENFNLPNGAFQEGVEITTASNGTIYTADGRGIVATYADADGALIVPDVGLTQSEFATTPFSVSLKWKLSSLTDGDYLTLFCITSKSSAPEVADYGDRVFMAFVVRSGAAYYEDWLFWDSSGAVKYFNSSASTWGAYHHVRSVSLDTEYTLKITYDPAKRAAAFLNDAETTAQTGRISVPGIDDYWWFAGDAETSDYHGLLQLDSLIVEKTEVGSAFISENHLLTERYHSNHFNGSALWVLNDFTTEVSDTAVVKNNILDYDPVLSDTIVLNRIGGAGSVIYAPSVKMLLNDVDISSRVISYSIDWGERFVKNLTMDIDQSVSTSIYRKNNTGFRTPQIEILADYDYSGTYVTRGAFFIESITDTISNGTYARRLSGRSRAALLDCPYSAQNTVSYENTTKRAIVTGLVAEAGLTCDWSLPDGPIEYHTFDARTPIEIIDEIVQAIGGRVSVDHSDNLYFYANDYVPENRSPALSVDSSDIHQVRIREESPQLFNSIIVAGRSNDEATFRAWAEVELVSLDGTGNVKTSLSADGNDYAVLVATCYDSAGDLVDTGLIEKESATPTDANTITVSKRIANGGIVGVWPDTGGGVPGTIISGPYTFDGSTITTTGNMLDGTHLVTYYGGDTVSFSMEGPGVVEETKALIQNGQGRTRLFGNELDAGTIAITATYDGQDSNPVALILGDPRVGDLDASANPTTLMTDETSIITARVYDPDGDPVGDGYVVEFNIVEGGGELDATSVATTTNTIENEEQVSSSYTSISVEHPISSLTHVYALLGDTQDFLGITIDPSQVDQTYDYADGAAYTGSTITLSSNLPKPQTRVVVTYESGGTAQVEYTAPSSASSGGDDVAIEAWAGGLNHFVFLNIQKIDSTGTATGASASATSGGSINSITFTVDYTPKSSDKNGIFTLSQPVPRSSIFDEVKLGDFSLSEFSSQVENGTVLSVKMIGDSIVATLQGVRDSRSLDHWNGEYVSGSRQVVIEGTDVPVPDAVVTILWDGGDGVGTAGHTETKETTSGGVFSFDEGVSGTHTITITHVNAVNPDAPLGLEELNSTITISGEVGPNSVRPDVAFYKHALGSFSVPIYYE